MRTDLIALFEEKCGISYERFVALVFGASSRYTLPVTEQDVLGEQPYLPPTFFNQTHATPSEIEAFFNLTGATLDNLKTRLEATSRSTDFSPIQATPLLRHADGTSLCLDPAFLLDKAGKGLFWTLRERLTDREGETFKNLWGLLSEEYLHWLW